MTDPAPATARRAYDALGDADRLLVRRFSGGLSPDLAREVTEAGGGRAWFEQQLDAAALPDPAGAEVDSWFPSLTRDPQQIFDRQQDGVQGSWEVMYDLSRWTVARRVHSRHQLHEQMVDFWSNLLNVPLWDDEACFYRVDYDRVIRTHALGRFDKLLRRAVTHPAMGLYLDNAVSTKDAPNENLGRELLELHTVGVDAGYTERDVRHAARMLTGYRVDLWWPRFRAFYDERVHATGRVEVMDFSHRNRRENGRKATKRLIKHLAHHPATARRLAHRLAVRFVTDTPSEDLVTTVAAAYLAHDTEIKPTLRALVDHPDFAASAGLKVRTPTEDYVATLRALRLGLRRPVSDDSFANAMVWQYGELGQPPYEWPTPDGYPETGAAWTSAGRLLNGMEVHQTLAAGWWPSEDADIRPLRDWLPPLPALVSDVIDHVSMELLGELPSAPVRQGVATALGLPLTKSVTRDHLWNQRILAIVASLLDSPVHLHR